MRALLVSAALLAAGCACTPTSAILEDFEGCAGACGFTATGMGSARVVSTILPGEHGLKLEGDVTATKPPAKSAAIDNTYLLSLVADCPAGLTASLSIIVSGQAQDLAVPLQVDETVNANGEVPDYQGLDYLPLNGPITLPMGVKSATLVSLSLTATPGAPCTVDLIKLAAAGQCPSP